jgi:hypothetical protein
MCDLLVLGRPEAKQPRCAAATQSVSNSVRVVFTVSWHDWVETVSIVSIVSEYWADEPRIWMSVSQMDWDRPPAARWESRHGAPPGRCVHIGPRFQFFRCQFHMVSLCFGMFHIVFHIVSLLQAVACVECCHLNGLQVQTADGCAWRCW